MKKPLIIVRGGGDLATGTIHRLWSAGFPVLVLEAEHPAAVRRQAAVCEAVYDGECIVEEMKAVRIACMEEAEGVIRSGAVPVLVDPAGACIAALSPAVVVDAIIAKKNLGTNREMAPLTIALGPGFEAGVDVDVVVETKRGHHLGRVIRSGSAIPNTGVPGKIGGYAAERVIHSPAEGIIRHKSRIGAVVSAGAVIAEIVQPDGRTCPVEATISGVLRGLIREDYPVTKGLKIADIDPREEEVENCVTISDKARGIAGGVLEAVIASMEADAF